MKYCMDVDSGESIHSQNTFTNQTCASRVLSQLPCLIPLLSSCLRLLILLMSEAVSNLNEVSAFVGIHLTWVLCFHLKFGSYMSMYMNLLVKSKKGI